MYVSPFYPVDGRYDIRLSPPGDPIHVTVALHRDGDEPFLATMSAARLPATTGNLLRLSVRYPWVALRTAALIRWQGIRLWTRGLKVQPR